MRAKDLQIRLDDKPFRAFRVHVSDGSTIDVSQPGMVIIGRTTAVLPTSFARDADGVLVAEHWRTIALMHMTQFSDLDEKLNGKRRRKR